MNNEMNNELKMCNNCENGMICCVVKAMYIKDENYFNDIEKVKSITNNFNISEDNLKEIKDCKIFKDLVQKEKTEFKSKKCPYNSKYCKFFESYKGTCELISKKGKIKASEYNYIPQDCIFVEMHKDNIVWDGGYEPEENVLNDETLKLLNERHEKQVEEDEKSFNSKKLFVDLFDENYFKGLDIVQFDYPVIRIKKDGIVNVYDAVTRKCESFEEINEFFKGKTLYYYECWIDKTIDSNGKSIWRPMLKYFKVDE